MVYKSGALKGQLTTPEIRKLISAHNKLTDIKIKKGATRDDIIKLLKNSGWSVDHEKQSLIPLDRPRKKIITLKEAKEVTKPKPKTELQKQKLKEKKEEKEVEKKKEVREIKKKAFKESNVLKDIKIRKLEKDLKGALFKKRFNKVDSSADFNKIQSLKAQLKKASVKPTKPPDKTFQKDTNPFLGKSVPKPKSPPPPQYLDKEVIKLENNNPAEINTLMSWMKKNQKRNFIYPIELTSFFPLKVNTELYKNVGGNIKPLMDIYASVAQNIIDNDDLKLKVIKTWDKAPMNLGKKNIQNLARQAKAEGLIKGNTPEGSHKMPDGTIMKDTDMKDYIKTTNVLTKPKSVKEKVKAIEKKTTPKPKPKLTIKDLDKTAAKIVIPSNSTSARFINLLDKNKKLFLAKPKDSEDLKNWMDITKKINNERISLMMSIDEDVLMKNINSFDDIKKFMERLNKDQKPIFDLMKNSKPLLDKIDVNDKNIKTKVLFTAKLKKLYEEDMGDVNGIIQNIISKKNIKKS